MILDFNTDSDYNSFRKSFSTNSDLFFQTATDAASVRQGTIHAPAHRLYAPHRKDGISLEQKRAYINRLWACTNIIDGLYYQCARTLGLKDNTLSLFYALADGQPHSQKQICEEYLIPKTTLNTIVREAMEKGLLSLAREEHSREKMIFLTEEGRAYARSVLKPLFAAEDAAMERTLEEFSPEFIAALEDFSQKLQQEFARCQLTPPPAADKM